MTNPPPDNPLEQFERSYCDCSRCSLACKTIPGSLAPGDFENIAQFCGSDPNAKFLKDHFRASDGPILAITTEEGKTETVQIPTIVPAQDEEGKCVFLDENDHCTIHPVAPFGCRMFKVCDPPSMEDDSKTAAMLDLILKRPVYLEAWSFLVEEKLIVKPIKERRRDMIEALREHEKGEL